MQSMQGSSLSHWSRILWCSPLTKVPCVTNTVLVSDGNSRSSRIRSYAWARMTEVNWSKHEWRDSYTRLYWIDAAKWRLIATAHRWHCCQICGFQADVWFLYAQNSCAVRAVWPCSLRHNTHFVQCHRCHIQYAAPIRLSVSYFSRYSVRMLASSPSPHICVRSIVEALHQKVTGMFILCWVISVLFVFFHVFSVYIYEQQIR
jgi:hypothetical protein